MAVKLGSDASSDAQITDGVGSGDVGAAGRLWVRFWPIALSSARQFVDPAEVPGLAAEALIGTIASIAVGRGPREDVATFVQDAVRELGEDDEPGAADRSAARSPAAVHPDVFASPLMSQAFAGLAPEFQTILWGGADRPEADEALTALQSSYLELHTENAPTAACRQAHRALADAVGTPAALAAADWVHMSSCAWCTEAFHELAFSSVAITALVDPALVARATVVAPVEVAVEVPDEVPVEVPVAPLPPVVAAPVLSLPLFADEPSATEPWLAYDETTETAAVDPEEDAGRRRRIVAMIAGVTAAAVIAVAAIAVAASSLGNGATTPPSAGHQHRSSSTIAGASQSATPSDSATTPSPSSSASVDAPTASPTPVLVVNNATATPKKPTPKPTSKPTPTATKPAASPTSKPTTPSPSPTPTKPYCNLVMHLLGAC